LAARFAFGLSSLVASVAFFAFAVAFFFATFLVATFLGCALALSASAFGAEDLRARVTLAGAAASDSTAAALLGLRAGFDGLASAVSLAGGLASAALAF